MAAEMAAYNPSQDASSFHHQNTLHPTPNSPLNNNNSSSDQDALFDLIVDKVPPQKREMLSTSWSKDYLNRLTSLPARALHNEPEKLREEQLKVERDMSELAFRDYKAFILVKDCKQDVQSTFETLGQHLDHFQDTIPKFVDTLTLFSQKKALPILERQHVFASILATHSQLLEVLEIPLLMETCVRNGYYNEALELASHVQRLVVRYPGIGIVQEIEVKVAQGKEMMLVQLLAQLREPIKLPVALRIIGFLRRIGSFRGQSEMVEDEEDEQHQNASTTAGRSRTKSVTSLSTSGAQHLADDETPLKMLFLKSRGLYMNQQLAKVVHHKGDSFGYMKRYIDATRECLFDILTYYKSIFGGVDSYTGLSSSLDSYRGAGSGSAASTLADSQQPYEQEGFEKQHCWTTDNLLADFVMYRTQTLMQVLNVHTPQIQDTSALSSILTQLMYFGANMAKIGFDLRYLVTSLFEEAVIRIVGGAFQRGASDFLDSLGGEGKSCPDWLLPSQWMLGGTGRAPTSSSPSTSSPVTSSTSTSPTLGRTSTSDTRGAAGSSTSMSPQTSLMDYPPLAYLTNAHLTALNSLRLLAPLSLAIPLREILVDSFLRVDLALEEYDRFVFGERTSTFRSRLGTSALSAAAAVAAGADQNGSASFKVQGMDASAVQQEQKIMDGFAVVYRRAVQEYILKCFDEGIYGGLVYVDDGVPDADEMDVEIETESSATPLTEPAEPDQATTEQSEEPERPEEPVAGATEEPSTEPESASAP
ncbi:conserved oligomeric Golgi complex component [Dissophora globulifera]|uniref:Conserved oligomeric Golgi complex subunit 8 n=1 Tax=Dissophora globulifera TaxID=979702 RepID=A0A9P6RRZ8_9FUNG|nr:conserved oligomeric Golgi complex component [Dissophora globulifera]